jgi:hypothetical protein
LARDLLPLGSERKTFVLGLFFDQRWKEVALGEVGRSFPLVGGFQDTRNVLAADVACGLLECGHVKRRQKDETSMSNRD